MTTPTILTTSPSHSRWLIWIRAPATLQRYATVSNSWASVLIPTAPRRQRRWWRRSIRAPLSVWAAISKSLRYRCLDLSLFNLNLNSIWIWNCLDVVWIDYIWIVLMGYRNLSCTSAPPNWVKALCRVQSSFRVCSWNALTAASAASVLNLRYPISSLPVKKSIPILFSEQKPPISNY